MQREGRLEDGAGEILAHYLRFYALRDQQDSAAATA